MIIVNGMVYYVAPQSGDGPGMKATSCSSRPTLNVDLAFDFVLQPDGTFVKVIVDDRAAAPVVASLRNFERLP